MAEQKLPSVKKNFFLSTLYQILTVITPFITAPYISRVLGSEQIGIYSYTNSIQTYFAIFAALGTATYGSREISRYRNEYEKRSKLFWEIELLSILTSSICLLVWFIIIIFSKEYQIYYLILTLGILSIMFDISWLYRGLEQFQYTVTKNTIFKILGVILLFIFVKSPDDLSIYILITIGSTFLGNVSMWFSLPKFIGKVKFKDLNIWPHFKETLVYFIPTVATSIYQVLDKTLIGLITKDPYQNGFYEQAVKVINLLKTVCFISINSVLSARISFLYKENKFDEIKQKIKKSFDYILFMSIGCCFGIIGIADKFVPLFFGPGYDEVILLLKILSPVIIIIGISNCLGAQYYNPAGLRKQSALYIIYGSILNLICNLIFIPKLKSYGAVIGTLISEVLISSLYLINCNKFFTFKDLFNKSWKKLISAVFMLIYLLLINKFINNVYILLTVQITGGAFIYVLLLLLFKDSFISSYMGKILEKIKSIKLL